MSERVVTLDATVPIWDRFFTVAPLVLIGTREADGTYDLAPKHMAMPLGWQNYFGFVCAPSHGTYRNLAREGAFTVTYPRPTQVLLASLAAAPRSDDDVKPSLCALPTFRARQVDGIFVAEGSLFLECTLDRVIDGFGANVLVSGRIVAAHADEEALRVSEREDEEVLQAAPLLAYLSPGRYAEIRQAYAFPFPVGFRR
ncbi:MAG TPA: flavin reductase [Isosphaeraceae bacterium]|nr:flavin reductase [Isosphaeraceae bacterium]